MVGKNPAVLVVDDDTSICDLLGDELRERGYRCITAFDGNDALKKLTAENFDVILLDIRLPGISGMEVLAEIRSKHHNVTAIMITAVCNIDTAVKAIKLGASDYIVKPFSLDRINTSICAVLEGKKHSLEIRSCEMPYYLIDEKKNYTTVEKSSNQMNAITYGVEARYDSIFGYSKIVIQRTIEIARQLGIPETEIRRWVVTREKLDIKKNTAIKSSLHKLERSPLAQKIMGMMVPHLYIQKPEESQN